MGSPRRISVRQGSTQYAFHSYRRFNQRYSWGTTQRRVMTDCRSCLRFWGFTSGWSALWGPVLAWCAMSVSVCFLWIETKGDCSLHSTKWLVFITETHSAYCTARTLKCTRTSGCLAFKGFSNSANKKISLSILKRAIIKLLISFAWLWFLSIQWLIRRLSHLGLVQECSAPSMTPFFDMSRVLVLIFPHPPLCVRPSRHKIKFLPSLLLLFLCLMHILFFFSTSVLFF